ncbi:GIY-YIG nuclease family protein [soil metagenome]
MKEGYFYIVASRPDGVLFCGSTSNLPQRVEAHRQGVYGGFTKRYNVSRLVYYEHYGDIRDAIQRERHVKKWRRAWKVRPILTHNPEWKDLAGEGYRGF